MFESDTTSGTASTIKETIADIVSLNNRMQSLIDEVNQKMGYSLDENSGQYIDTLNPIWADLVRKYGEKKLIIDNQARELGINVDDQQQATAKSANELESSQTAIV